MFLFPQVLDIVWQYVEGKVVPVDPDTPLEEIALLKYRQQIVDRLTQAIEPDTQAGEAPLLPIVERFRTIGSTGEVLFRTTRPCVGTTKSHISHVVLDAPRWEHTVAYQLERMAEVVAYARNDHMDFTVPYEWEGNKHEYRPDYLVRLRLNGNKELRVVLEVKGFETEQDRQKEAAAYRWVSAVNHHREFGAWAFAVCKDPHQLKQLLGKAGSQSTKLARALPVAA